MKQYKRRAGLVNARYIRAAYKYDELRPLLDDIYIYIFIPFAIYATLIIATDLFFMTKPAASLTSFRYHFENIFLNFSKYLWSS